MEGSRSGESREHHHRPRRLTDRYVPDYRDSNTSSGRPDRYVPSDRPGSRASTRSGTDSYVPTRRDSSSRDTHSTPRRSGDPRVQHIPRRIDRYVPSGHSGSHASTGGEIDSDVPTRRDSYSRDAYPTPRITPTPRSINSGTPVGSTENTAPSGLLDSYRPADDELTKKKLAHKDIKPGMCVWADNRELEILSQYYGKNLMSKSGQAHGRKHLELVVSKSRDDDPRPHVRTVMLTTFGGARSLKERGIFEDKWKECVPRVPAMKECDAQYGPVEFERGLRNSNIVPGWILIHARNFVHANSEGKYECFETEMSSTHVAEMDRRAKAHENEFAIAARDLRASGLKLAESSQPGKRRREGQP
ncbi:hypothetical protein A7U60_g6437 [Sanghuangporus baumii]|uniref:Uncharacterized protein n=1 Tax=Sanghuangporus baumii TaxID=108892 RepID=A0A9Q5HV79_SANBA|nr:hypothetical protein A7U60_g6437 [Sanghuangporus baumii]